MSFLIFISWLALHTLLINIACQVGWNFDPGYFGPLLLVVMFNVTIALYTAKTK